MAIAISDLIRIKIYNQAIPQRLLFVADDSEGNYTVISNEEIDVGGGVTFTLESINTQPLMFGCTPQSNVQIQICNSWVGEYRRYSTSDLGEKAFRAYFGVQLDDNVTRYIPYHSGTATVVAACKSEDLDIRVLSNGHVVGNKVFGSMDVLETESIMDAKIAIVFDTIYLRYKHNPATYRSYMIRKVDAYTYGDLEEIDSRFVEQLDDCIYKSISYSQHYMEIGYDIDTVTEGYSTWGQVKNTTWGNITDEWGEYSGYQTYRAERYYSMQYGVWNTEMPRRTSTDVINLSAFDNMSAFDVDSLGFITWLKSVRPTGKITCLELVSYLCQYCGLGIGSLANFSWMGGGYQQEMANMIDANAYQNFKSCKDILSYALEVGATNGLIDRYGNFRTYHSIPSNETDAVEVLPYVYTTDVADYVTPGITNMLAYKEGEMAVYIPKPGATSQDNYYEWSDNPFFNKMTGFWWYGSDNIDLIADYRDAVVTTCANYALWCDDVYSFVVDGITCVEPIFTMTVLWNGHGTVTYTNSGCKHREPPTYEQRENGIVNSNIKTVNADKYRVTVGDRSDSSSNQIELTNEYVMFGNNLSSKDERCKTLRISNAEYVMGNKTGYVYGKTGELEFSNVNGQYKFAHLNTSASAANLCVDPDTGRIYRVTSLAKSKNNVLTIVNPWDKVDNLRGVSYTSNCDQDDPNQVMFGFIAEEVEESVPELAEYSHGTLSSVQYDRVTSLLVEDCKESHKRIRELEVRLEELERRLNNEYNNYES